MLAYRIDKLRVHSKARGMLRHVFDAACGMRDVALTSPPDMLLLISSNDLLVLQKTSRQTQVDRSGVVKALARSSSISHMEIAACRKLIRVGRSDGRVHWGGLKRPGDGLAQAEPLSNSHSPPS